MSQSPAIKSPLSTDCSNSLGCTKTSGCTKQSGYAKPSRISQQPVHNRILAILSHTTRFAFKGETRLAQACGASPSAISRIVTGQTSPSFSLVVAITKALEKQIGKRIDPREIVSLDGTYPTPSVCELMGCKGCLPAEAFDGDALMTDSYQGIIPGSWSGSVAPRRNRKQEKRKEVR